MDTSQNDFNNASSNNILSMMLIISSRIQTFIDFMLILEGRYNDPEKSIDEKCAELFDKISAVKKRINSLRSVLKQLMEQIELMGENLQKVKDLRKYMEYIKNHIPAELLIATVDFKKSGEESSAINSIIRNSVSPVPLSWSQLESPCVNVNPTSTSRLNSNKSSIKSQIIPSISYVTESEMNTVPKYMRGRLNATNINKLIDSFNTTYKKKYETIKKPKKTIKPKELDHYCEWKRDENTEPKGTFFVTVNDINMFGGMKMDKSSFNIVTILRHLKRIRETRHTNGQIHFILL